MKVYYISPATIPSRSANSIHVINMCEALAHLGYQVTLFARTHGLDAEACNTEIRGFYGIDSSKISVATYQSKLSRGAEFGIALLAVLRYIKDRLAGRTPDYVISRNLYAAALFGLLFRKRLIYETHVPEKGLRFMLQRWLLKSGMVETVVISNALRDIIAAVHGISCRIKVHVFHDAARDGRQRPSMEDREMLRLQEFGAIIDLAAFNMVVGYFGHLYPGRGVEVVEGMASANPQHLFVVYGGNEQEIKQYRANSRLNNLLFMGHIPPCRIYLIMASMDVLLMPYQRSVSVGLKGVDTAHWMSPMKLFEYMSAGVPIISSDLSVLREVLVDEGNCLLVEPDDIRGWCRALNRLSEFPDLGYELGERAFREYHQDYTWKIRAAKMLQLVDRVSSELDGGGLGVSSSKCCDIH